jgi:membrane associated rhomboid family serine protease
MKKSSIIAIFMPAILLTAIIWITFFFDNYFSLNLWQYGLFPRTLSGLKGIITMPFLHGDIGHIINNTIPLIVLTTFLYYFYSVFFIRVYILIWLISGIWTWVFARPSFHIGASAIIYGLAAFIFFAGIFIKEKKHTAISMLIVFLYGSIVWGIFPIDFQTSWEGHLTGFVAGIMLAIFFRKELKAQYLQAETIIEEEENDDEDDDPNAYWKQADNT